MEKRTLRVIFNKRGGGDESYATRLSLPKKDLDKMGVTMEDREVEYEYDDENKKIIISKNKNKKI